MPCWKNSGYSWCWPIKFVTEFYNSPTHVRLSNNHVSQCLFAYHIESLITTVSPDSEPQREPQRLNTDQDAQFFSVGRLNDRTLIIYVKKKGVSRVCCPSWLLNADGLWNEKYDSVFHVLEPVPDKFAEKSPNLSSSLFGTQRSEWFQDYKVGRVPERRIFIHKR